MNIKVQEEITEERDVKKKSVSHPFLILVTNVTKNVHMCIT